MNQIIFKVFIKELHDNSGVAFMKCHFPYVSHIELVTVNI